MASNKALSLLYRAMHVVSYWRAAVAIEIASILDTPVEEWIGGRNVYKMGYAEDECVTVKMKY